MQSGETPLIGIIVSTDYLSRGTYRIKIYVYNFCKQIFFHANAKELIYTREQKIG